MQRYVLMVRMLVKSPNMDPRERKCGRFIQHLTITSMTIITNGEMVSLLESINLLHLS